jgi:ATP-dependent RNA helicase DDX47/RRP3
VVRLKLKRAARNPVKVSVVSDKGAVPKQIKQSYLFMPAMHKQIYLAAVLNELRGHQVIVFGHRNHPEARATVAYTARGLIAQAAPRQVGSSMPRSMMLTEPSGSIV